MPPEKSSSEETPIKNKSAYKPLVLLVEETSLRTEYMTALEDIAAVDLATDVASAVALVQVNHYAVAVLEVRLGDDTEGGFRIADALAKTNPLTQLIFNSAFFSDYAPEQFYARDATCLVAEEKLHTGIALRAAVRGALRAYTRAEETALLLKHATVMTLDTWKKLV